MRRPIAGASLIACVALFPLQNAAGEEPAGMIGPAPASPNTVGRTIWTHDKPSIPTQPDVIAPSVETPGQPAATSSPERRRNVEADEGAFLLPTWGRGFWVMPPGGLTRYLIPPRGFINPDETLAPGSLSTNSS
jgi:hypothetical protein